MSLLNREVLFSSCSPSHVKKNVCINIYYFPFNFIQYKYAFIYLFNKHLPVPTIRETLYMIRSVKT